MAHPLDDARFPAIAPLLGTGHLAIDADARDPRVAGLLRSILLRLVGAATPGTLLIRVIDAAGDGETTAAFAGLPNLAPPATDHPGMQSVLFEADQWIRGARPSSVDGLDGRGTARQDDTDQFYVLVIASLPELTDGNDLTRIAQLARAGVANRLHLIVAGWPPPPLTAETTQPPLPYSTQVSLRNPYVWVGDPPGATYAANGVGPSRLNAPVYLDSDPPADVIRRVCAELAAGESGGDPSPWTPSYQRWRDYVSAAQRLDAVRREAAKVVTDQTAAVKRVRTELTTVRRQVALQHKRIGDLVRNGQPVSLHPAPAELGAADAALGRLAQAASERAAAARRAAAAQSTGSMPTGAAINPGTATGGFPVVTRNPASHYPPARYGPAPPGWPPNTQPGPNHRSGPPRHSPHVTGPVQYTGPARSGGPPPYAPVSGPAGRPPTSARAAYRPPPVSGPAGRPPTSGPAA